MSVLEPFKPQARHSRAWGIRISPRNLTIGLDRKSFRSDSEDEDCHRGGGNASDIFKQPVARSNKAKNALAPIELRPDRTFLSFQGRREYHEASRDGDPSAPPGPPVEDLGQVDTPPQPRAYEPDLRNQHGAAQMASPRDLSAIFKGGPRTPATPATAATADESSGDEFNVSAHLDEDYPLDDRIPSIRLANRVHQNAAASGSGGLPRYDSYASFTDASYTTLDDDESYYSFLDDDPLNDSLRSGSGSGVDLANIKRRESLSDILRRANSAGHAARVEDIVAVPPSSTLEVEGGLVRPAGPATDAMAHGPSLSRRSSGSKESFPSLGRRSRTFDPESDSGAFEISGGPLGGGPNAAFPVASLLPGPSAQVRVPSSSDDGVVGASYSRRRQRRSRRRRRDEARAVEWLDSLRGASLQGSADAAGGIAEAASSRFMTAGGSSAGATMALGGGVPAAGAAPGSSDRVPLEQALGLPHTLCRSSTIEAGPLVGRLGAAS